MCQGMFEVCETHTLGHRIAKDSTFAEPMNHACATDRQQHTNRDEDGKGQLSDNGYSHMKHRVRPWFINATTPSLCAVAGVAT